MVRAVFTAAAPGGNTDVVALDPLRIAWVDKAVGAVAVPVALSSVSIAVSFTVARRRHLAVARRTIDDHPVVPITSIPFSFSLLSLPFPLSNRNLPLPLAAFRRHPLART